MPDRFLATFRAILERLLVVWLTLLCLAAFYWTSWLPGRGDPFVGSQPALSYLIAATMMAVGSLLPEDEIRQVLRRWPLVLGGTAVQYTAMPLLAYCVGLAFGLEGSALNGCIIVGCVPGAMASNVLTLAARGNVSYSVSLTTSSTLLSPLVVPLTLKLTLGQWVEVNLAAVSVDLFLTVVLPVVAGYACSRYVPGWRRAAERSASIVANLTILWIIAMVVGLNRDRLVQLEPVILLALVTVNAGGYLAGYFGGRALGLSDGMRRALTLEIGMQNAGLGTKIALQYFADPATAIPCALYTFGCMFTGTALARLWAEFGGDSDARGQQSKTDEERAAG